MKDQGQQQINNNATMSGQKKYSQEDVDQWLAQSECTLRGNDIPWPIFEFCDASFPAEIIDRLYANYEKPTPIQSISWPVALNERDMISIAKTGSGKTLGFILPAIVHIMKQPARAKYDGPIVVVLLPTRELAIQVEEVAKEYGALMGLSVTCCYGGAPKSGQERDLFRGVDICICTPGRILDFLRNGTTNMKRCTYLVLDEADRMLDMGFEPQIREVIYQIRADRQTLMFSATWPKEVHALASEFLRNPVHLNVGSLELAANHNIKQHVEVIEEDGKINRLFIILDEIMTNGNNDQRTLIFVSTKRKADDLTRGMRRDGWPTLCIHGDKEQREREWVLGEFKAGKTQILIATDVAARGLDVDDIKFVINYDYPNNSEDYVHRIGRTGRRERTGTAITFFTPDNAPKARDLIKVLEEAKQVVPRRLAELAQSSYAIGGGSSRFRGRRGGGGGSSNGPTGANNYPVMARGGGRAGGGGGGFNNNGYNVGGGGRYDGAAAYNNNNNYGGGYTNGNDTRFRGGGGASFGGGFNNGRGRGGGGRGGGFGGGFGGGGFSSGQGW